MSDLFVYVSGLYALGTGRVSEAVFAFCTNDLPLPVFLYAISQAASKAFLRNGGRKTHPNWGFSRPVLVFDIIVTGKTEMTDSAKWGFGLGQNFRDLLRGRKGELNSLSTLPANWFTIGHSDRHFLTLYIQKVGTSLRALWSIIISKSPPSAQIIGGSTLYLHKLIQISAKVLR